MNAQNGIRMINYGPHMTMKDAPVIRKLGVVGEHGEMTPIVFQNKLCMIKTGRENNVRMGVLCDAKTQETISTFGYHRAFYSAYCEDDVIYAFGTRQEKGKDDSICMYVSSDGREWQEHFLFSRPGWSFFNTSVCKGPDGYRMALEVASADEEKRWNKACYEKDEVIGHPFTEFFLKSDDLYHWTWMPERYCFGRDRYVACPAMRYSEGYYYLICLEELPLKRYAPYIYRTEDFITWEIGLHNPVLMFSREDHFPKPGIEFSQEQVARFRHYMNINDCDVDLCEYEGKTHIYYLTGDQLSYGVMCEALYDGPLCEFYRAFFE
ncbi:MAG: hypothetical protein IJ048_04840 [Clostridia bacterium]|nr:hypothetical protein [Clostridia bacterium]